VLLLEAIKRAERGLIDADLGGGVIKQRVPREGEGRSGGYRTLIFDRQGQRTVFVDGFAKSDLDNISRDDVLRLRELAREFLNYNAGQVASLVRAGAWIEVKAHVD
jgi:hypothetical protein